MYYQVKYLIMTLITVLSLLSYNLIQEVPSDPSVLSLLNHSVVQVQTLDHQKSAAIDRFHQAKAKLSQGESQVALEQFQQILAIFRALDQPIWAALTLNEMGSAYRNLGQYQMAEKQFQQVLEISTQQQNLAGEGTSYTNLGTLYRELGQYSNALFYQQKALKIFEQLNDPDSHSSVLSNLGVVYQSLGQYEQALRLYEQALATHPDPGWQATVKSNIGSVYSHQGKYEEALTLYQEALDRFEKSADERQKGRILNLIGSVQNQLQQPQTALYTLHRALDIRRAIQDRPGEGTTLDHLGTVYHSLGQYETALDYFQQALEIARTPDAPVRPEEACSLSHMGLTLLKMGRYSEAADALLEAITIWESLRPGLSDENKVSLQELQAQTYTWLQEALIHQNQVEAALEISERGRARAFVELIASSLKLSEVESYQAPSPLTFSQIQQIARRQQATLVEYSYINQAQTLCIWVIQPDGSLTFRTVDLNQTNSTQLLPSASNLEENRGEQSASSVQITLKQRWFYIRYYKAYRQLIEPILDLLPTDPDAHLIFIPQGDLFMVPFAALSDQQGQYLIEKHTILVSPSIQVLDLTEQKRQTLTKRFDNLIVGNPKMPMIPPRPWAAPRPLSPLPGTEKEATVIAQLLKTQAILGETATEDLIVKQMPKAKIIHLATHGLLDELSHLGLEIPGALAFTPNPQFDQAIAHHNGLLTAGEILDLQLNAELVVLSACNTGRGTITSDGVIGLSRSFISAGVPSIVVSLWFIPDGPSADLMIEFYRQMQQVPDKAAALRQAMLKTMKDYPDPQNWAAFLLVGQAN